MATITRTALNQLVVDKLSNGTSITAAEHRDVEYALIDSCRPYNVGFLTLGDILGSTIPSLSVGGEISSASSSAVNGSSRIIVNFTNTMPSSNYYVRIFINSLTGNPNEWKDATGLCPVFRIVSTTQIEIWLREALGEVQSIKLFIEAIPLPL